MTYTSYTLGDWQQDGVEIVSVHRDADGKHEMLICDVFDQHGWWRANAKLISAAPALLTALELAEEQLSEYCNSDDARDYHAHFALRKARDAIAKAKGEVTYER